MNTKVIYDLCGIFVPKATLEKGSFTGHSVSPDFDCHYSVIFAYIFDVNSSDSRQSGAVYLSVLYALLSLNDEAWGTETEYKVSYFLECI